jgi:hypothetical protein
MTQDEMLALYQEQLVAAQRQLGYFEKGMRWKTGGVDRTDFHIQTLKKIIENLEKLLGYYGRT